MTDNRKKTKELVSFRNGNYFISNKEIREDVEKKIIEMTTYANKCKQEIEKMLDGKAKVSVILRVTQAE